MRQFFLLTMLVVVCGCHVMPPQTEAIKDDSKQQVAVDKKVEVAPEPKDPTLWKMMSPESHIDTEEWCVHDGKYIQVLQVAEEFEDKGVKLYFMICTPSKDRFDRMTIGVISRHAYVTSEMLRPGNYMYLKPYSYKNKNGDDRTIRMYLEEPREKEMTEEEKAEMAKEKQGE